MALRTWGLVLGLVLSVCDTYGESDGSKLPPELRTAFAEFEAEAAGAEHAHGRKLVIAFDSFQKNANALTDADAGLSREKRANDASRGVQEEMPALDDGRSKQAAVASHVRSVLSADDSGGGCTSTCLNMTCDEWVLTYDYTCGWLESEFSCSCAGCSTCEGGDGGGSDDHGGDDQGDDDYDDLYEIVELLDDDDNGGSGGGDGDDHGGDDHGGDDYDDLYEIVELDGCPSTCYGYSCDDWATTCSVAKSWGCDCSGCSCSDDGAGGDDACLATSIHAYSCSEETAYMHICANETCTSFLRSIALDVNMSACVLGNHSYDFPVYESWQCADVVPQLALYKNDSSCSVASQLIGVNAMSGKECSSFDREIIELPNDDDNGGSGGGDGDDHGGDDHGGDDYDDLYEIVELLGDDDNESSGGDDGDDHDGDDHGGDDHGGDDYDDLYEIVELLDDDDNGGSGGGDGDDHAGDDHDGDDSGYSYNFDDLHEIVELPNDDDNGGSGGGDGDDHGGDDHGGDDYDDLYEIVELLDDDDNGSSGGDDGDDHDGDDHGGDDHGGDDYDDLYEIVELLDDDDNGGSRGGDGDDYAGDDYDGDDSGYSFRYENLTTLADRCCLGVPEDGAVFTCYMPEVCGEGGAPTPTAVPTGPWLPPTTIPLPVPTAVPVPAPSAVPLPTPSSKPTSLAVLSTLVTVGLAGFSCSDFTDAEAAVLELAVGDVMTNLQSTEATGCTSNRRLTGMGTQHLRHRRRLEDGDSSIDMTMTAFAHHTNSTTSSEFADEANDVLTSAVSTGSLASAISSRASDAGVTSFSSVSVSSATVSTHSPTAQPTRFPSPSPTSRPTFSPPTPKPTGVYCTDGVQNGDETSTDCGGSCSTCAFGESCGVDSDCASSTCQGGVCITSPPTAAPTLACEDLEFTPPQLQEAKFSSTAGQLFLTWSLNTDRAGLGGASFECDQLLDFPAVSYATCVWTSQQSLTVSGLHPGQSGVVDALVLIGLPLKL